MIPLKKAIQDGKLDQFIQERSDASQGNAVTFNRTVQAMTKKSKPIPKTSSQDSGDD